MEYYINQVDFATPECGDILRLRYDVLRKPLNLEFEVSDISQEFKEIHWGCYSSKNDLLLGCLLLRPMEGNRIKMRQVAVQPEYQGKGVGQLLVAHSETWSREHGFDRMELHARITAVPFYEKLGYTTQGKMFQEVHIDHYFMFKIL